jgi:hypothetical protein
MSNNLIWFSQLDEEDLADLTQEEQEQLINCLDEAVMIVCSDFGLFQ